MYKQFRPLAPSCAAVLLGLIGAFTLPQLSFDVFQIGLLQRQHEWLLPMISAFAALMWLMMSQAELQTQLVEKDSASSAIELERL